MIWSAKISRYIARAVLLSAMAVLGVLLALDATLRFISELSDVGKGQYSFILAVLYVGLQTPARAFELLPTACLVGALLGLGALANHSELVAVRAAGYSSVRILRSVLLTASLVISVALVISEFVVPTASNNAVQLRTAALSTDEQLLSKRGLWVRDRNRIYLAAKISPGPTLDDVTVFHFADGRLHELTKIARARYQDGEWRLTQVASTAITEQAVSAHHQTLFRTGDFAAPEIFSAAVQDPENLSFRQLWQHIEQLQRNQVDSADYRLAFWHKLVVPISSAAMMLVALPLVFGSARSGGIGQRIFIGSVLGIIFFVLDKLVSHFGIVYGLAPALSAALPTALLLIGALWLVRTRAWN